MATEILYPLHTEIAQLLDEHGVPHEEFQASLEGVRIAPSLERDRFMLRALTFVSQRYAAGDAAAAAIDRARAP